ncbi:MAG TPA: hypothetical protein VGN97_13195 [Mesorhizobium sp.]|jgi:hypothetical protein|nr:hypothetical protein [Mesorhizobium sp.]
MSPPLRAFFRLSGVATLLLWLMGAAWAQEDWRRFRLEQLGFSFEAPPSFELDGNARPESLTFSGPNGARLSVGGAVLDGQGFRPLIEAHLEQDRQEGLDVTYRRFTPQWVSYSGFIGDAIRYVRSIRVCGDRVAIFVVDYDRAEKRAYDPVVTRMVRSLRQDGC